MITRTTIAHGLGGAFLAYALLSSAQPILPPGYWTVHLAGLAIAYTVGTSTACQRLVWLGFATTIALGFLVSLLGWYINIFTPAGLFGNLNWLGMFMAVLVIAALAYDIIWFLPIGVFGLWWSASRAAIVCAGLVALLTTAPKFRLAILTITILAVTLFMYKEDKSSSFMIRLGVWQDTIEHLTLWGKGWGSFATDWGAWPVHRNATFLQLEHSYNDVLELIHALGLGAIPLFLLVILALDAKTKARPITICFVLLGLTYFPFWIPGVAHMFAFALGSSIRETANKEGRYGKVETDCFALH